MNSEVRRIELVERVPSYLEPEPGFAEVARAILRAASGRVTVEAPDELTRTKWRLLSEGWVGQLPVLDSLVLVIRPKVPIGNLFRMVEVAYRLPGLEFPEGQGVSSGEVADLFDRLASILARRTLLRIRRGLHREYVRYEERLPFVRGRLVPLDLISAWQKAEVCCQFEDQTADIPDNQILYWTLRRIARSGIGRAETRAQVRQTVRSLAGTAQLMAFSGHDCLHRTYQRLNADYRPLHGLCRFFLEALGPTHETGDATMVPFLVDMDRLFELFVAEWLISRLPARYALSAQERVGIDCEGRLVAQVDLLIRHSRTGRALAVLDTKYKSSDLPLPADLYQINSYADLVGAPCGLLIYPTAQGKSFHWDFGGTDVANLGFDLGGDLEKGGGAFLADLLGRLDSAGVAVA